jgi:hypothetical protein
MGDFEGFSLHQVFNQRETPPLWSSHKAAEPSGIEIVFSGLNHEIKARWPHSNSTTSFAKTGKNCA